MAVNFGLRTRFLLATLTLAIVLVGGFTFAIQRVLEVLEIELVQLHFRGQFERFVANYPGDLSRTEALPAGFRAYVIEHDDFSSAPAGLRAVPPGLHVEYPLEGKEYTLGRENLRDTSLFLLVDSDLEPIERLEDQLLTIAMMVGGIAVLISAGLALWLAHVVIDPVRRLANRVDAITPGESRMPLAERGGIPEITKIADAFDRALDHYDTLVERELAFNRDASHELRTPLTVILTSLELLGDATSLETVRARLDRVRAAAQQMRWLIDGLLFLARPVDATTAAQCRPSGVVVDAVRIQRLAYGKHVPAISVNVEGDVPLHVPRGLLLCVVNNLLRNALEHSGGSPITLILKADALWVEDAGPGIFSDFSAEVFAKHVRGPDSSGEGLGLYIVKRICDRLGWRISVENQRGAVGARFRLDFSRAASGTELKAGV